METVSEISENEMVATFLRAEIESPRFQEPILNHLKHDGRSRALVDEPDLANVADNAYRKELLTEHRGYGRNHDVFYGFPNEVGWARAVLTREELDDVKYLNYDYWVELSGGSRLVVDGARSVRACKVVFRVPNTGFWRMAETVRQGVTFLEPIAVSVNGTLVLIDGHTRMTGYVLAEEASPNRIPILAGFFPGFAAWDENDFS